MKGILKNLFVIFVSVLIFSSCAGKEVKKQEYTAVGRLYCEDSYSNNEEVSKETTLNTVVVRKELTSYAEFLSSNRFLQMVSDDIDGIYAREKLLDMISMNNEGDNILIIEVTADNPEDALTVCESIFELAPEYISQIVKGDKVTVLDKPVIAN